MSDIGFSDQVPSLPGGGGNVAGIGATFTPDLSTGTGGLSIPNRHPERAQRYWSAAHPPVQYRGLERPF